LELVGIIAYCEAIARNDPKLQILFFLTVSRHWKKITFGGNWTIDKPKSYKQIIVGILCSDPNFTQPQRSGGKPHQGRQTQKERISFYVRNISNDDLTSEDGIISAVYLRRSIEGVLGRVGCASNTPVSTALVC
jgi:hypothetical protein